LASYPTPFPSGPLIEGFVTNGIGRVWLRGEIDLAVLPASDLVVESVTRGQPSLVLIDVSDVTFMDASGLGILADLLQRSPHALVYVIDPPRVVTLLLRICGLDLTERMLLRRSRNGSVLLSRGASRSVTRSTSRHRSTPPA
jgi:anti-anti-sigma factor